jgi:hypothetical protein
LRIGKEIGKVVSQCTDETKADTLEKNLWKYAAGFTSIQNGDGLKKLYAQLQG